MDLLGMLAAMMQPQFSQQQAPTIKYPRSNPDTGFYDAGPSGSIMYPRINPATGYYDAGPDATIPQIDQGTVLQMKRNRNEAANQPVDPRYTPSIRQSDARSAQEMKRRADQAGLLQSLSRSRSNGDS